MIKLLSAASFLLLFTVLPLGSCDLEYPCIQATPSHHTMVLTAIEDASAKIESGLFVDAGRVLDNAWRYVEYELCYSEARERMRSVLKNATIEILAKATIPGKSFISFLVRKNSGQIDAVPLTAADISDLISTLPSILTSKLSATSEDADLNDVYNLLHHVFSSIEALGSYSSKSDLTTRFYAAISQPLRSLTSNQLELLLSFNGFDASFNNTLRSIARACSYAENFDTTSLGHVEETISLATTSAEQGNFANACLLMNMAWDDFSKIDLSVRLSHYSIIKDAAERLYTLADTPCKKWELVFEASAWCAHLPVATISASDFKNELQQRMAFVESEVKNAAGNRAILTFQKMVSALSYIQRNDPASYASILAEYKNVANGVLSRIGSSVDTPIRETFQLKIDSL